MDRFWKFVRDWTFALAGAAAGLFVLYELVASMLTGQQVWAWAEDNRGVLSLVFSLLTAVLALRSLWVSSNAKAAGLREYAAAVVSVVDELIAKTDAAEENMDSGATLADAGEIWARDTAGPRRLLLALGNNPPRGGAVLAVRVLQLEMVASYGFRAVGTPTGATTPEKLRDLLRKERTAFAKASR